MDDVSFDNGLAGVSTSQPDQGIDNDGLDLSKAELGMAVLVVQKKRVKLKSATIQFDEEDHLPSRLQVQLILLEDAKTIDGDTVKAGRVVFDGIAMRTFTDKMTKQQVINSLGQFQMAFVDAKKGVGKGELQATWDALKEREAIASFSTRTDKQGEVRQNVRYNPLPKGAAPGAPVSGGVPAGLVQ